MPVIDEKVKIKKKIKKRKIKISKFTIVTVVAIIVLFAIWQLLFIPYMVGQITIPPVGQIPPLKHGDEKFIEEQLSKRVLKNIPSLTPPAEEIGKKNPFE
jgi:fatty acid desaturase